jgi:iron complex transport system ATP-binding protein
MSKILKANNIFGGYPDKEIIKGLSLDIEAGSFLGIIGPNGSGKTTLLKLFSRSILPTKGSIEFEGKDIFAYKFKELYQKMAFVSQNTDVSFPFSVWEVVLMGRIPHLARFAHETAKDFAAADEALGLTGCRQLKDKAIDQLSAGERQMALISKSLAQEPVLLFLDEPTSHLDIGHQIQILDLLRHLNRRKKMTIVVVLHDLNLAGEYCDRIVLLNEGKVFADAGPNEVLTYQNIEKVYKTVVVVKNNPLSNKPYVALVPGEK